MDIDGSRRISFFELERMIREKLKVMMTKKAAVGDAESWVNPTDDAK